MRYFAVLICLFVTLSSCKRELSVQLSGRVDGEDTVVMFRVNNQEYLFPISESRLFSGKIEMKKSAYARVSLPSMGTGFLLFLAPEESLELVMNMKNPVNSLQFRGTLGVVNTYMREEGDRISYPPDLYNMDEVSFVNTMKDIIDSKILMLDAKNLGENFNVLERERIRYLVAERAVYYPRFHRYDSLKGNYVPGEKYTEFMAGFPLDNDELANIDTFRRFLMASLYVKNDKKDIRKEINYISRHFKSVQIKDYLLPELAYRYVFRDGLKDADYLLGICRKEVTDPEKIKPLEQLIDQWRKLSPGVTASDVPLLNTSGENESLHELRGKYLYISVWSSWTEEFKKEFEALRSLEEKYKDKNIRFLTFSLDGPQLQRNWKRYLRHNQLPGEHYLVRDVAAFYSNYMISDLPRYILLDPSGHIVDVKAVSPSGNIEILFRNITL